MTAAGTDPTHHTDQAPSVAHVIYSNGVARRQPPHLPDASSMERAKAYGDRARRRRQHHEVDDNGLWIHHPIGLNIDNEGPVGQDEPGYDHLGCWSAECVGERWPCRGRQDEMEAVQ